MNALFATAADDYLNFGRGAKFDAKKVADWMSLDRNAVSKLASVATTSVRWDDGIPNPVRERLEELANLANLVAGAFNGDGEKSEVWFRTKNPMLGNISPREMVRLGRADRLRRFIVSAIADKAQARSVRAGEEVSAA